MARARKGRPIDGWLVIDKPEGVTSTQVVGKVRWALGARKAGHAGTLDPLASGVLAVALGEATKTIPHIMDALKAYRFTIRWGMATNTDDVEGGSVATSDTRPGRAEIAAALGRFIGEIMQTPPQFSAIKIDGKRAYDLARGGETVMLAARPIWVKNLTLIEMPDADHAVLEMVCGKGGYVRAIARDLGRDLGCFGHIVQLRRIWSGPFAVEDAILLEKLDELRHIDSAEKHLLPVSTGLDDIPALAVTAAQAAHLRQGRAVPVASGDISYGETVWASYKGRPVAVGIVKGGKLHPSRVFNFNDEGDPDVDHCGA